MGIFLQKPRSYVEPPQLKRREPDQGSSSNNATSSTKRPRQDEAGKRKNEEAAKKGWLELDLRTTVRFPDIMQETPCKNFATVGKFCRFPKCRFKHGGFPGDYSLADQKVICSVVAESPTDRFSAVVRQADIDAISGQASASAPVTAAATASTAASQA